MSIRIALPFLLVCCSLPASGSELGLTETDEVIRITLRGKPVLEYVKMEKPVPEGVDPVYRRSGYIHPVYTPGGQEITGDFPLDHAHQHALFFAWTRATFDGEKIDFWNAKKQSGRVEHRGVVARDRKDAQVSFTVKQAFVATTGAKPVDVLHETWTVTVYHTPEDHFLFDIKSVQECAAATPLILEKYHYGGMALRGNAQWLEGDVQFLTSEGKGRVEANHSRPDWVAMSGTLDGKPCSIAVLGHPENFRAPQPVRVHPNKPYFCFAPMVEGAFRIEPGKPYVSKYRYVVGASAVDPEVVDRHWKRYADK